MSQEIKSKLGNLVIDLARVRESEKALQELGKNDDARMGEVRRLNNEFKVKSGRLDEDFQRFLRDDLKVPENFHLLDLVDLIWKTADKTLIL